MLHGNVFKIAIHHVYGWKNLSRGVPVLRELSIGVGLLLVLGSPLHAQTAAPAAAAPATPETITVTGKLPDGHKRVCETSAQTGSILIKRVCRTKQEWEDIRIRSLAALERIKKQEEREAHIRASRRQE